MEVATVYCPKCAAQNNDDGKFCRACGANLALIPQALTGELPSTRHGRKHRDFDRGGPADFSQGIAKVIMGLGFILVSAGAYFFAPAGRIWWFWMLIPAFTFLGKGVAEILSARHISSRAAQPSRTVAPSQQNTNQLPDRNPAELMAAPPSITESTTKLFDEADRQK
jgi:hypothetical protein